MKRFVILLGVLVLLSAGCSHDSGGGSKNRPVVPGTQSTDLEKYWYKNTSFYHIWVKSFATGALQNSESYSGTFNGIKANLDYIKDEVGCDGIWLSPIFQCANNGGAQNYNMHGYDTTNFEEVNSNFGTADQLGELITACHEKGMKIIFDFVPNHTSSSHPWFGLSCNNDSTYKDWYVWDANGNSHNPCNVDTHGHSEGGAWFWNNTRGMYYYGAFGDSMPDLNYNNAAVREYMLGIAKKWLDFGFDGIRVDACQYLVETDASPAGTAGTHAFFKELRALLETYTESPKFMVGETWVENDRSTLNAYFGTQANPEFNMVFDFDAGRPILSTVQAQSDKTGDTLRGNPNNFEGEGYGTFLANHDVYEDRIGTEFNGDSYCIKLATAMSLMRSTVPFIYYGQEIGMKAPNGGYAATNYSDMEMRYCFKWDEAKTQKQTANSILKLNKALNTLRKDYPQAFACGTMTKVSSNNSKVLAYTINGADAKLLCVFNISENAIASVNLTGGTITGGESSTLVGDTADSAESTFTSGNAVIKGIAPYAYRVYLMNDNSGTNYFDDEEYTSGDTHIATKIYLRGFASDGWSWTPSEDQSMTRSIVNNFYIWKQDIEIINTGDKEFKFTASSSSYDTAWGGVNGITLSPETEFIAVTKNGSTNIKVNIPSAGTYTVIFNQNAGTVKVVPKSTDTDPSDFVYLRGIPGWDANKCIPVPLTGTGIYSLTIAPNDDVDYSFKFCKTADSWSGKQWASPTSSALILSDGVSAATGNDTEGGNLQVHMDKGNSYLFELNISTNKVTVTKQ